MTSSDYERQLVRALTAGGRVAMRAPTSGSATDRDLPDVLAGRLASIHLGTPPKAEVWAIEAKVTSATTAYAEEPEVDALRDFCEGFGAVPYLAAKFKRPGGARSPFWIVAPVDCRMTPEGNYGIPESDVEERARFAVYTATENKPAEIREVDHA